MPASTKEEVSRPATPTVPPPTEASSPPPLAPQNPPSGSLCPSSSSASTHTVDSSKKLTLLDQAIQDDWTTSTESDLLNIEEFKERMARAKLWRDVKKELKAYVAKVKSENISRKFEVEIKVIGR